MLAVVVTALSGSVGCAGWRGHCPDGCGGPLGCRPCTIGWQRGGSDYQRVLGKHSKGRFSSAAYGDGGGAGGYGPQGGTVAYPYYTVRGPRDFLMDNPPSIGGASSCR